MDFIVLSEMTLEQKIGHLIVARGYIDEQDKAYILDVVKKGCLGGIQMRHHSDFEEFKVNSKGRFVKIVGYGHKDGVWNSYTEIAFSESK